MFCIRNPHLNRLEIGTRFETESEAIDWLIERPWLNAAQFDIVADQFKPAPEDFVERGEI